MLDGVDVATVNLHELRHAITVVSQASNLLFGTLRYGLHFAALVLPLTITSLDQSTPLFKLSHHTTYFKVREALF